MSDFEVVIGLEVHVQLATKSKLFCSCPREFGQEANSNVCEICAGMPGVLPVPNKQAIEFAVKMGLATNCSINKHSYFARKNYFYPDLPKGYQISQFEEPICIGGFIEIETKSGKKKIGLTRIHLEDDAGKNIHSASEPKSFVDLNRAGTPLCEVVSEPDMRSSEEALLYLKELYSLVVGLGFCDGNMEEGNFRCDANISLRPFGQEEFGTRTELKNLNSFKNIQKAIECEIARQEDILLDNGIIVQETRLYDVDKNRTISMRSKEEAQDYRYFPDPDLITLTLSDEQVDFWTKNQDELPSACKIRYMQEYKLNNDDAQRIATDKNLKNLFEDALKTHNSPKRLANIIQGMLMRELNTRALQSSQISLSAEALAELAKIIDDDMISMTIANDIFPHLFETQIMPKKYVEEKGLAQVSDTSEIEIALKEIMDANPTEVAEFKGGKTKLQGFFVGQVMKKMAGKANPALVNKALAKLMQG